MKDVIHTFYKEAPYKHKFTTIRRFDSRSAAELIRLALAAEDEEAEWEYRRILQDRGTSDVLTAVRELCLAGSISERVLGTDILGQITVTDATRQADPVTILLELLEHEHHPDVLSSAVLALGYWSDLRIIAPVLQLQDHPDSEIRYAVVQALLRREDERAIATLIALSDDPDSQVRDWATFGLGSMIELDTPAIRDALYARVMDVDDDTRGEAFVGLAQRGDPRVVSALLAELAARKSDEIGSLLIDATLASAQQLRDPRLYPTLLRLHEVVSPSDAEDWEAALKGCWNKRV